MVFWMTAAAAALCWAAVLYPYAIYPLLLRFLKKRPVQRRDTRLNCSLLFCAHNEAQHLPAKLANLGELKRAHPQLEILAYDDASNDGTLELLERVPDLLTVVRGSGRTGKAAGMKRMAALATGEILIFTDANVLLAANAIDCLLPYYGDPDVGGVCGTLRYSTDPYSATSEVGSLYWRLDEGLRTLESNTGNVMGADGSIFSVRRALYPDFPETVLDDLTVSMNVVFKGKRLIKAPDVVAYENSISDRREELRRKIRIGARAYHTHIYLRPNLGKMSRVDRFKYFSRKMCRWFGGGFIVLGGVFTVAALSSYSAVAALACIVALALTLVYAWYARTGAVAKIGDAVFLTFATQYGILLGMRGLKPVTWSPSKTR
jgi:cellulose synthase/poly-beta-1,6-N-acetylglucosamine synthase-like glycosyltransferase